MIIALDIAGQMEDLGHEVVGTAMSAETAIALARELMPDLAIMDLQLANRSRGQDAALVLRSELGVPSIFLSGSLHLVTEQERRTIRPLAMLSKPTQPHELANAVQSISETL